MFEQPLPEADALPAGATAAVRGAIITGFALAAVYLLFAVYLQSEENNVFAAYALAVGLVLFVATLVAFAGQHSIRALDRTRLPWMIGGYLAFPLGLVMVFMANWMDSAITRAAAKQESMPGCAADAASPPTGPARAPISRRLGIIVALVVVGLPVVARSFIWQKPIDTWSFSIGSEPEQAGLTLFAHENKSYADCVVTIRSSRLSQEWGVKVAEDLTYYKSITIPWASFTGPEPLTREIALGASGSADCFVRGSLLVRGNRNSGVVYLGR